MQRSPLLTVVVHCPHFDRPVQAQRNVAVDRLVACADSERCRAPAASDGGAGHDRPYPAGCPVFPSLAR